MDPSVLGGAAHTRALGPAIRKRQGPHGSPSDGRGLGRGASPCNRQHGRQWPAQRGPRRRELIGQKPQAIPFDPQEPAGATLAVPLELAGEVRQPALSIDRHF